MGLFTFLKNGLTIEKKKKIEPEIPNDEETTTEATTDTTTLAAPEVNLTPAPVNATVPAVATSPVLSTSTAFPTATPVPPVTPTTPTEKKIAENILYHNIDPLPNTNTVENQNKMQPVLQTYTAFTTPNNNFNNALLGQTVANQNLLVIAPKSTEEISPILSNLVSGNACIVSLVDMPEPQRLLDYLSGFINAIGGTIMQYTTKQYILTPNGVGIKS